MSVLTTLKPALHFRTAIKHPATTYMGKVGLALVIQFAIISLIIGPIALPWWLLTNQFGWQQITEIINLSAPATVLIVVLELLILKLVPEEVADLKSQVLADLRRVNPSRFNPHDTKS